MNKIKIFLTDDHQIMIDGLKSLLLSEPNFEVVGEASNGIETLKKLETIQPDILLLDLIMPRMDGLETIKHLKKRFPNIRVIMLTTNDEGSIITTLFKEGATGFLLKNSSKEELIDGVKKAHRGEKVISDALTAKVLDSLQNPKAKSKSKLIPRLTKREKDVLKLIAEEKTTKEIADELFISTNTVVTHRRNLLVKFDAKTSVGLVKKALEFGLV